MGYILFISVVLVLISIYALLKAPRHWMNAHLQGDPLDPADPHLVKMRHAQRLGWSLFVIGALIGAVVIYFGIH